MYIKFFKPFFDFSIALIVFVCCIPVLIVAAILIKLTSRGPVFFVQSRLGKDKRVFELYKFRTMLNKKNESKDIFKGDPDVTAIGYWLRRLKIDELPQLFNVLLGDMSIVGPRPCLPFIDDKFDDNTSYRFLVKPGLTSLAAIKGGIYLSWPEKWIYDRIYVEKLSFRNDIYIILKTGLTIISGEKKYLEHPKCTQKELQQN